MTFPPSNSVLRPFLGMLLALAAGAGCGRAQDPVSQGKNTSTNDAIAAVVQVPVPRTHSLQVPVPGGSGSFVPQLATPEARDGWSTAVGDWGHFLSFRPRLHVLNPDGRAFMLRFHIMLWPMRSWNPDTVPLRITGPDGNVVLWKHFDVEGSLLQVPVPRGEAGGYTIDWGLEPDDSDWSGPNVWMETDLPAAVLWTGDPSNAPGDRENAIEKRRAIFQASVPRRWWFWVPDEVTQFRVVAQRADRYMSQREDWGLSVISPRGQRVAVLWGQPPLTSGADYRREMERTILVEPGAGGRFWAVEVRNGDSHHHSKVNIALDGVPPYLARSPEEWFNPETGTRPIPSTYDDDPFVQALFRPGSDARWPHLQHWSPCPSLGDPDGNMVRGSATFALQNPEGRTIRLALADYLPRVSSLGEPPPIATVSINSSSQNDPVPLRLPVPHYHGSLPPPPEVPALSTPGVHRVTVPDLERWWAFTMPATPLVLLGEQGDAGWSHFNLEVGSARNWYFKVPKDAQSFLLNVQCDDASDAIDLQVNAPDRTVARIYANAQTIQVPVPAGLDDRIWHLRTDVGSASRFFTTDPRHPRYAGINVRISLHGLPPFLAPTREQWFLPEPKE